MKITGELTMSFPAGIVHVFSGSPAPPVLSFRLLNTALIEQFLPSAELVYRYRGGAGLATELGGGTGALLGL